MTGPRRLAVLAGALFLALAACKDRADDAPKPEPGSAAPAAAHVAILPAGEGPVAALVQAALARAKDAGGTLLVYVGAPWCEPCTRFHDAVAAGQLDAVFPRLSLLEFDLDRDRDRLAEAGYDSKYIPLLAVPAADGRASDRRMEGSVKGDGALANMVPRLQALLAPASPPR
jgi:hypothetical protein